MNSVFLGARLFYWLYLLLTLMLGGGAVAYWQRERIKKRFYELTNPEKLIKIGVVYPGNWIRYFYRLIPREKTFTLPGGLYNYNDKEILKNNDFFIQENKEGRLIAKVGGQEYNISDKLKLKLRWERWPQIYFRFGNPWPLIMAEEPEIKKAVKKEGEIETEDNQPVFYNASDLEKIMKSKLITQLLESISDSPMLKAVIVLIIIAILVGLANLGVGTGLIHVGNVTGIAHP